MIARLRGTLDSIAADRAVIDVGGVGYAVFASRRTLSRLAQPGGTADLLIETHVREDHIHLYGFIDARERELFSLLLGVSGVGSKVALAILSVLDPDTLATAIAAQDKAAIGRAQGVGPKLAQRIVSELRDKVVGAAFARPGVRLPEGTPAAGDGIAGDAIGALLHLGYGRAEAFTAIAAARAALGDEATLPELIRAGLRELGR